MLTVGMALKARAEASTGVTGLISTRFYMGVAPETASLPYVVCTTIDAVPSHHMKSASGLPIYRLQLDCYSTSQNQAETVMDKIRLQCDGYRGTITVGSDSMAIRMCHWAGANTGYVNPFDGGDVRIRRASHDYRVATDLSST